MGNRSFFPNRDDVAGMAAAGVDAGLAGRLGERLFDFFARVPESNEPRSARPHERAKELTAAAARAAAAVSGGCALVPGPLGLATIVPEVRKLWDIQSQLVADIAGVHGKSATLTGEQMLYCMFMHTSAQYARTMVVRAGERVVVRRASTRLLRDIAAMLGVQLTREVAARAASRAVVVAGAAVVLCLAYVDTRRIGRAASDLFGMDIELLPALPGERDVATA